MRIAASRRDDDFELNAIPLIDVMLTLLMFFVLTTTFIQQAAMQVTLPEASATDNAEDQAALVILIDREGRYYLDNNEVLNPGLETLKQSLHAVAGDDRQQRVIIRADAGVAHQSVITAMDALGQLGFSRLSLATTAPQDNAAQ